MSNRLKVVFMGTPEFAMESLKAILVSRHQVVAVVTVPDKPAGRGKKIQCSAVKNFAIEHDLPLLQPLKLRDPDFLSTLKSYNPDVFVVVAFRMLPAEIWTMPKLGTFNLHASLLPQYRGAAPINWAIINGEKKSGVTTFFIDQEIDTGKIISQKEIAINATTDAGDLHDKLMVIGADLVVETLDKIADETIETTHQNQLFSDSSELKNAPKIFKDDCKIDWALPVHQVFNLIRGLSPYPAAYTTIELAGNKIFNLKLFETRIVEEKNPPLLPGEIQTDGSSFLHVKCSDGMLSLVSLQLEGKKRMKIEEFLNGFRQINSAKII